MKLNTTKLTIICGAFFLLAAFNTSYESISDIEGHENFERDCFRPEDSATVYQIDSTEAMGYIQGYEFLIDSIKMELEKVPNQFPNKDEKLIYGVQTTVCELKKIIASSAAQDESEVWIMMGAMSDNSTEMIFVLEGLDSTNQKQLQFFDFTRPCPNSCPNWSKH